MAQFAVAVCSVGTKWGLTHRGGSSRPGRAGPRRHMGVAGAVSASPVFWRLRRNADQAKIGFICGHHVKPSSIFDPYLPQCIPAS